MIGENVSRPMADGTVEQLASTAMQGDPAPAHGVYRGSDEMHYYSLERGFGDFEAHMRMVFPDLRPLDRLIEGRVEAANKSDEDVVIVDLGAGVGNFTREPLVQPSLLSRTRKRLGGQSCRAVVRLYSVTDAASPEDHLQMTPFPEAELPGNEQFTADEVQYSITSTQTVKGLLEGIHQPAADMIVASAFMQYLQPQVFEKSLQDTVDTLKPGGLGMVFGYSAVAGRLLSVDDGYAAHDAPVTFTDPRKKDDPGMTGDAMREWATSLIQDEHTSSDQLQLAIIQARHMLLASDYFAQPELGDFRGDIRRNLQNRLADGKSPREVLGVLVDVMLPFAEDSQRIQDVKVTKDAIIDDLAQRNASVASIRRKRIADEAQGLDAVVIRKHPVAKSKKN